MLKIHVAGTYLFNENTEEFITVKDTDLVLEHSLISIAKWESKWHKPFLDDKDKNEEEIKDYIRCMTISQNVDPVVYAALTPKNIFDIKAYMNDKMTATWFSDKDNPKSRQKTVTAELIYYWMISLGIPFKCETWHLNRLLTLIRVCNIENAPKKKMKKGDIYKQNAMLNNARKQMMNSSG